MEQAIKMSASHIRSEIRGMKAKPWPPQPDEVDPNYIRFPNSLMMFLNIVLVGENSQAQNARTQRLIQSLAQDFIYSVSNGRVLPAKQIPLPMGIKTLTGNVELIKILNRLGHGISYSKLEEMDTAWCLQKQTRDASQGVILPSSSHTGIPIPQ